MSSTLGNW